ncbi:hypothetical protein BST61_g9483 [Cercospora zeina]
MFSNATFHTGAAKRNAQVCAAQSANTDLAGATLAAVNGIVSQYLSPITSGLNCPAVGKYDQTLFNRYPGRYYSPQPRQGQPNNW